VSDDNRLREQNMKVIERFFSNDYDQARRDLWHDDVVFELPFERGGRVVFKGRNELLARTKRSHQTWKEFQFKDLRIYPALDPELFFVMHTTDGVATAAEGGHRIVSEHISMIRVRDGKIIHRVEYQNPIDWEWWKAEAPKARAS
jgi:ketosteroid isomerase-like protein